MVVFIEMDCYQEVEFFPSFGITTLYSLPVLHL